jgi:ABC-type transporter Mla subunit MlaD
VDVQSTSLELIVQQVGEAVLTTTETVEQLSGTIDVLAKQVQQQGYQIFALSDAVQTIAENQDATLERLGQLTETLQRLVSAIEDGDTGS